MIQFGNLTDLPKEKTSKFIEACAEIKTEPNIKGVDFNNFVKDFAKNNFVEDIPLLISFAKNGEKRAFNKIDNIFRPLLLNIATAKVRDRAFNTGLIFDLVQNTLLKVYENIMLGKFDDMKENDFRRFMIRMLLNSVNDIYRPTQNSHYTKIRLFRATESGLEVDMVQSDGNIETSQISSPLIALELNSLDENKEKLAKALNKLNDNDRRILDLKYIKGYSHQEISEEFDLKGGSTSMVRTKRALEKLKKIMA
mgnify:CR=1 FL=1